MIDFRCQISDIRFQILDIRLEVLGLKSEIRINFRIINNDYIIK